jgi:hypothetical protein
MSAASADGAEIAGVEETEVSGAAATARVGAGDPEAIFVRSAQFPIACCSRSRLVNPSVRFRVN